MRKVLLILIFIMIGCSIMAQSNYSIEIPQGFKKVSSIGKNVDLKAEDSNGASIVVVIVNIPKEYGHYTIWDMLGDLDSYIKEYEEQGHEYVENPKIVKYGKTIVNQIDAFWYDFTATNPNLCQKTYQVKKGLKAYTVTLSCPSAMKISYVPIWFRVKNSIKFN